MSEDLIEYNIKGKPAPELPKIGIVVDASTTGGNPGHCECQGVDIESGEIVFSVQIGMATNNIAEYIAIASAVDFCKLNEIFVPIYSDSKICINWANHNLGCKTNIFKDYPDKAALNPTLKQQIESAEKSIEEYPHQISFWDNRHKENPADYGRKNAVKRGKPIHPSLR